MKTYKERVIQHSLKWVNGNPVHNQIDDECVADFSCCMPELFCESLEKRMQSHNLLLEKLKDSEDNPKSRGKPMTTHKAKEEEIMTDKPSDQVTNAWTCKVAVSGNIPNNFDFPMRQALIEVLEDYGVNLVVIFSGWGGSLSPLQKDVLDNKL